MRYFSTLYAVIVAVWVGVLILPTDRVLADQSSVARQTENLDPIRLKTLRWLSTEPVSLLDIGILRLRDAMERAADPLLDEGIGLEPPRSGAYYTWRQRGIVAYATFAEPYEDRTESRCTHIYDRMVEKLTERAPRGPGQASWFLEDLFTHTGQRGLRPHELGSKLVGMVTLEISLSATAGDRRAGDHLRIRCRGRLDAEAGTLETRVSGRF